MPGRRARALDKLMSTTGRLPAWSGFVLAAGLYASLHVANRQPALLGGHGSTGPAGHATPASLLLGAAQYLLPTLCLLLTLRGLWRRHRMMRREQAAQAAARAVAELDGRGFARLIAESFQQSGYRVLGVHGAGVSGGRDNGADIELSKDGELRRLREDPDNPQARRLFRGMAADALQAAVRVVTDLPPQAIRDCLAAHGARPALAGLLLARQADLARQLAGISRRPGP